MTGRGINATIAAVDQKLALLSSVAILSLGVETEGADHNATSVSHRVATPSQTPPSVNAEVEITGTLKTPTRTKKFVAFVAKKPCDPKEGTKKALRTVAIDPNVSMNFFLEVFVPQGSTGHVCGAGYDERDKLVLFGAYSGNPLTFRGTGEVTFSQVIVTLQPVSNQQGGGKAREH